MGCFVRGGLLMLTVFLLAGCSANRDVRQDQQPQTQAAAQTDDDAVCKGRGFQPGTSAYVECRKNLDKQHLQEESDSGWNPQRENTVRSLLGRPPAGF
jgi:hypothetical protein